MRVVGTLEWDIRGEEIVYYPSFTTAPKAHLQMRARLKMQY